MDALRSADKEIFEDQIPLAAGQWAAAVATRYLYVRRFGSGFDFDDPIKRVAIRAMERVRRHDTPQRFSLLGLTWIYHSAMANSVI